MFGFLQESLGSRLVEGLGDEPKRLLVSTCISHSRLREAAAFVRQWGLRADFPDVERQYQASRCSQHRQQSGPAPADPLFCSGDAPLRPQIRSMEKLMERELWDVAASFAGDDRGLQTCLLTKMAMEGELAMAEMYRQEWNLPHEVLQVSDSTRFADRGHSPFQSFLSPAIPLLDCPLPLSFHYPGL